MDTGRMGVHRPEAAGASRVNGDMSDEGPLLSSHLDRWTMWTTRQRAAAGHVRLPIPEHQTTKPGRTRLTFLEETPAERRLLGRAAAVGAMQRFWSRYTPGSDTRISM